MQMQTQMQAQMQAQKRARNQEQGEVQEELICKSSLQDHCDESLSNRMKAMEEQPAWLRHHSTSTTAIDEGHNSLSSEETHNRGGGDAHKQIGFSVPSPLTMQDPPVSMKYPRVPPLRLVPPTSDAWVPTCEGRKDPPDGCPTPSDVLPKPVSSESLERLASFLHALVKVSEQLAPVMSTNSETPYAPSNEMSTQAENYFQGEAPSQLGPQDQSNLEKVMVFRNILQGDPSLPTGLSDLLSQAGETPHTTAVPPPPPSLAKQRDHQYLPQHRGDLQRRTTTQQQQTRFGSAFPQGRYSAEPRTWRGPSRNTLAFPEFAPKSLSADLAIWDDAVGQQPSSQFVSSIQAEHNCKFTNNNQDENYLPYAECNMNSPDARGSCAVFHPGLELSHENDAASLRRLIDRGDRAEYNGTKFFAYPPPVSPHVTDCSQYNVDADHPDRHPLSIFIGNIPHDTAPETLLKLLASKGAVSEIVCDFRLGVWLTAYVTYERAGDAVRAVEYLNGRRALKAAAAHRLVCCFAPLPPASLCCTPRPHLPPSLVAPGQIPMPPFFPRYARESDRGRSGATYPPKFALLKDGPPGANLFLYGIPSDWTEVTLLRLCQEFGHVVGIRVPGAPSSGPQRLNKGFAFVSYDSTESSSRAMNCLSGRQFLGKSLNIQLKLGEQFPPLSNLLPNAVSIPLRDFAQSKEGPRHSHVPRLPLVDVLQHNRVPISLSYRHPMQHEFQDDLNLYRAGPASVRDAPRDFRTRMNQTFTSDPRYSELAPAPPVFPERMGAKYGDDSAPFPEFSMKQQLNCCVPSRCNNTWLTDLQAGAISPMAQFF